MLVCGAFQTPTGKKMFNEVCYSEVIFPCLTSKGNKEIQKISFPLLIEIDYVSL